jgi:Na+-driven multidrug efflux pump
MNDLTTGPVGGHIRHLSAFIALTTLFQTLYFLADLYFVGRLGKEAIAGVGGGRPGGLRHRGPGHASALWNFVASGLVFVSASVFQGMGNTVPPLASSTFRLLLFVIPATLLARQPGFQMRHIWYLAVGTVALQLAVNLWLLHREFDIKLSPTPATVPALEEA